MEERLDYYQQQFDKQNLPQKGSIGTQFEDCVFNNCDFTNNDFNKIDFIKCTFESCNLSMVKFANTGFDQVVFNHCKLVGADFSHSKDFLFSIDFKNSILDYVSFAKKKNRKSSFINCSLKGADFTEADFTNSVFEKCDLDMAVFDRSILTGADFRSAYNFIINPEKNQLRKAKFMPQGLAGLLTNYDIIVQDH